MSEKQPEALRIADELEAGNCSLRTVMHPAAAELRRLHAENEAMRTAIKKLHSSRGRYHTQIAACDLYEMCNLPTVRPTK